MNYVISSTGSEIVQQLSNHAKVNVRAAVHNLESEAAKKLATLPHVHLVQLNGEEKVAAEAFKDVHRVILIGPVVNYEALTKTWLNAAKNAGVHYLGYFSAVGVSEQSVNGPLQIAKTKWLI